MTDTEAADLAAEQLYLDRAHQHLAAMAARTDRAVDAADRAVKSENTPDARIARYHLERRRHALNADAGPLCFGRIDDEEGERWYVGRRHVEDAEASAVVVDWRAPVSAPFYRATAADPCGLVFRRRFSVEGRTITHLFDEHLDDPDSLVAAGIPDPLLAELDRSRTGRMADIVATIAAEQDEIIRSPLAELLVVQGGPGTGKTAVGLHRAAFLLFQHRSELAAGGPAAVADAGVLVIGPNPLFLRYISEVLPSLGEVAVRQTTLAGLLGARYRVRRHDADEVRAVKGQAVMAEVVAHAVRSVITVPDDGIELRAGLAVVRFSRDDLEQLVKSTLAGGLAQNPGRDVFRRRLLAEAWRRHCERPGVDPGEEPTFSAQLRSDAANKSALDRIWPLANPVATVERLYRSKRFLAQAAAGRLSAEDQALLARPAAKGAERDRWSEADVWLLDEAETLCNGVAAEYGHIVVDEAQDLAPMALRMVGRRSPRGSMTILGDLAQATAANAVGDWTQAVDVLLGASGVATDHDRRPPVHLTELTVGYRVPATIIELANRLLPEAAPTVTPVRAVRDAGDPPLIVATADRGELLATAAREAALARRRGFSVALVAVGDLHSDLGRALVEAGVPWSAELSAPGVGIDADGRSAAPATVLEPLAAKGLEFDAVVVVEPASIVDQPSGLRHLYVSMTRAVQHLGLVHHRPLPRLLTDPPS